MKIGLFLGDAQYGAAGIFLRALRRSWRADGHQVIEIAIGDRAADGLREAAAARVDLVFAYNGVGGELQVRNRSLYELIGARFVAWLVDHPAHHRERLLCVPEGSIVACVDATHPAYLPLLGMPSVSAVWLPHFGCEADTAGESRDVAVLCPGSIQNPDRLRREWQANPVVAALTERLLERTAGQARIVWHDEVRSVLDDAGAAAGPVPSEAHAAVVHADRFVRATRRVRALAALRRAGVTATVCGHVEDGVREIEAHEVRGPVPFADLLTLMTRARVVVDTGAAFPAGSHERGLSALINGAAAVVERNAFWDRVTDGEVLRFSWQDLERFGHDTRILSEDTAALDARRSAGRQAVAGAHTAAHRAAAIVDRLCGLPERTPSGACFAL